MIMSNQHRGSADLNATCLWLTLKVWARFAVLLKHTVESKGVISVVTISAVIIRLSDDQMWGIFGGINPHHYRRSWPQCNVICLTLEEDGASLVVLLKHTVESKGVISRSKRSNKKYLRRKSADDEVVCIFSQQLNYCWTYRRSWYLSLSLSCRKVFVWSQMKLELV